MSRPRVFIDTEFNSYLGALISLALVDERGDSFYVNLGCAEPHPWVAEHVMPVLRAPVTARPAAQEQMQQFLLRYVTTGFHLVADWPDDIAHFCQFLITGPGERIATPHFTMEIDRTLSSSASAVPHNALEDAIAIRHQALCR